MSPLFAEIRYVRRTSARIKGSRFPHQPAFSALYRIMHVSRLSLHYVVFSKRKCNKHSSSLHYLIYEYRPTVQYMYEFTQFSIILVYWMSGKMKIYMSCSLHGMSNFQRLRWEKWNRKLSKRRKLNLRVEKKFTSQLQHAIVIRAVTRVLDLRESETGMRGSNT